MIRKGCHRLLRPLRRVSPRPPSRVCWRSAEGYRDVRPSRGGRAHGQRPHALRRHSRAARRLPRGGAGAAPRAPGRAHRDHPGRLRRGAAALALRPRPPAPRAGPHHPDPLHRRAAHGLPRPRPRVAARRSRPISRSRACRRAPGLARYGRSLTAHLDALGLLGPGFSAAHAVLDRRRTTSDASPTAARRWRTIPSSNLRLGAGIARAHAMHAGGVPMAIGTDGANTSDSQSVFEAIRLAAYLSRGRTGDSREWLSVDDVLRMATEGGAALTRLPRARPDRGGLSGRSRLPRPPARGLRAPARRAPFRW